MDEDATMDDSGRVAHGTASDRLDRLADRIGARAQASAVFEASVERADVTVIPVARVRWGFGGGGGESDADRASGFGAGGGMTLAVTLVLRALGRLMTAGGRRAS